MANDPLGSGAVANLRLRDFVEEMRKAERSSQSAIRNAPGLDRALQPPRATNPLAAATRMIQDRQRAQRAGLLQSTAQSIPTFDTIQAQIEGWDELPYSQQLEAYNTYLRQSVDAMAAADPEADRMELEFQLREASPAPAEPSRSALQPITDTALGFGSGVLGLLRSGASALDPGGAAQAALGRGREALEELQSPVQEDVRRERAFRDAQLQAEGVGGLERFLREAGNYLGTLSLGDVGELAGNVAPTVVGSGGVGLGVRALGGSQAAARRAAVAAGVGQAALLGGGDAAQQAYAEIMELDDDTLQAFPEWSQALDEADGDAARAREALALRGAREAQAWATPASAGLAVLPGSLERTVGRVVSGQPAAGGLVRAAGRRAGEATLEGLDEVVSDAAANYAVGGITGDQSLDALLEGTGGGFAAGALGGAGGGLATSAAGRVLNRGQAAETDSSTPEPIPDAPAATPAGYTPGAEFTDPDGSTYTLQPDDTLADINGAAPPGGTILAGPDGAAVVAQPDGGFGFVDEAPAKPAEPATYTPPRVTVGEDVEGWENTTAQTARDRADALGVTADIERLLAEGESVSQIATQLGDRLEGVPVDNRVSFVHGVRSSLGAPLRALDEQAFDEWAEGYRQRRPAEPVTPTAPAEPVTPTAPAEPVTPTGPTPAAQEFENALEASRQRLGYSRETVRRLRDAAPAEEVAEIASMMTPQDGARASLRIERASAALRRLSQEQGANPQQRPFASLIRETASRTTGVEIGPTDGSPLGYLVRNLGFGQQVSTASRTAGSWAQAARSSDNSLRTALEALTADQNAGRFNQEAARGLLDVYDAAGIPVPSKQYIGSGGNRDSLGSYDTVRHQVTLNSRSTPNAVNHEALHGLTSRGLFQIALTADNGNVQARNILTLLSELHAQMTERAQDSGVRLYGLRANYRSQLTPEELETVTDAQLQALNYGEMLAELMTPEFLALAATTELGPLSAEAQAALQQVSSTTPVSVLGALVDMIEAMLQFIAPGVTLPENSVANTLLQTSAWLSSLLDQQSAPAVAQQAVDSQADGTPSQNMTREVEAPQRERSVITAELRRLRRQYQEGTITGDQFTAEVSRLMDREQQLRDSRRWGQATRERARGPDYVRERLLNARRRNLLPEGVADMGLWFLDQNPNVAVDLGVSIRTPREGGGGGAYNQLSRIASLFTRSASPSTAVHEILHHTERMLPDRAQTAIRTAYKRALESRLGNATLEEQLAIADMIAAARGDRLAAERRNRAFRRGTLSYNRDYQLANASEFWAVNATRILQGRYEAQGSWVRQVSRWLAEFVQRAAGWFGLPSDSAVLQGLRDVLGSRGAFQTTSMLAQNPIGATSTQLARSINLDMGANNLLGNFEQYMEASDDTQASGPRPTPGDHIRGIDTAAPAPPVSPWRGFWQAAARGDVNAMRNSMVSAGNKLNELLHDHLSPVKRWVQSLPEELSSAKDNMIRALYAAPNVRDQRLDQAMRLGGNRAQKLLANISAKHNLTPETVKHWVGTWVTAGYAETGNAKLIARDTQAVADAQRAYAADPSSANETAMEQAVAQLERRQRAVNNSDVYADRHVAGVAGYTNAAARHLRSTIESRIPAAEMQPVADAIQDMLAWSLVTDVETGKAVPAVVAGFLSDPGVEPLLQSLYQVAQDTDANNQASVEALQALRDQVVERVRSNYVPLTGNPDSALDTDVFSTGSRAPNTASDYRLEGRTTSVPDDAITATWAKVLRTANYAGWAPFQDAVADVYSSLTPAQREEYGLSRTTLPGSNMLTGQNAIVRRRGNSVQAFTFRDPKFLEAIRGANVQDANAVLNVLGTPTRWYSYAATQLNLFFAPVNYIRDAWERSELARQRGNQAQITDAAGNPLNGTELGRRILSYTINPLAAQDLVAATGRYAFKRGRNNSSRAARMLQEMLDLGGASVWGDRFAHNRTQFIEGVMRQRGLRKGMEQVGQIIDGYNRTFDLVPVLASYMAARDMGATQQAAAQLSLDLMNFRKRGASMGIANAMFAFAQPAITGGANAISALYDPVNRRLNPRGWTRLLGTTIAFAAIQSFARMLADDDEGGNKLDQVSDFTHNNSLVLPFGDKGFLKVPLAFGLTRVANGMARNMIGVSTGEVSPMEAFGPPSGRFWSGSVIPVFSPIEDVDIDWTQRPTQAFAMTFAPSWLKPVVSVAVNRTASDAPVVYDNFEKTDEYRSEQFGKRVPEFYRDIARFLRRSGGPDMAPEEIRTLIRGYPLGSLSNVLTGVIENPHREAMGRPTTNQLISRFYGTYSEGGKIAQFYDAMEDTDGLLRKQNAGESLTEKERQELMWRRSWDEVDKVLRRDAGRITRDKTLSEEGKERRRAALRARREREQVLAVYRYRQAKGLTAERVDVPAQLLPTSVQRRAGD